MAVTVAELVAEPHLNLSILAGFDGTRAEITWAHTSDLPALWEWVTGGELMMTNGLSLPADAAGQVGLAESLVSAGASALAIGERMHAPRLTEEFLAACDALPLPLLNIPYPMPFVAISQAVAEANLLEQSRRVQKVVQIYETLRDLRPTESGWQHLLTTVGDRLGVEVYVADARCLHPWHPGGRRMPDAAIPVNRQASAGHADRPQQWGWLPVSEDRQLCPMAVPAHPEALIVFLAKTTEHPDASALLHAAAVIGLQLSATDMALTNRRRDDADVLRLGLEGRYGPAELESRFAAVGLGPDAFVAATVETPDGESADALQQRLWRHSIPHVALEQDDTLLVLLPAETDLDDVGHVLPTAATTGLSTPKHLPALSHAVRESRWALSIARQQPGSLLRYGPDTPWYGLTDVDAGQALVDRLLGPLLEYDATQGTRLVATLRTYLDEQRSWQRTAARLFTHRQTIIYRMKRVHELTGMDTADSSTLAQLWFALQLHDILSPGERDTTPITVDTVRANRPARSRSRPTT